MNITDIVAWKVEIAGMTCIVFAASRKKAQWIATKSYWEAYGNNGQWPCAVAWRVPQYDQSRLAIKPGCYGEDYVFGCLDKAALKKEVPNG